MSRLNYSSEMNKEMVWLASLMNLSQFISSFNVIFIINYFTIFDSISENQIKL